MNPKGGANNCRPFVHPCQAIMLSGQQPGHIHIFAGQEPYSIIFDDQIDVLCFEAAFDGNETCLGMTEGIIHCLLDDPVDVQLYVTRISYLTGK